MDQRTWRYLPVAIASIIACCLPAQAQQIPSREGRAPGITPNATTDPLKALYWIPGARDVPQSGADKGVATAVHCSSFSSVAERIQYVVRNFDGTVKKVAALVIPALATKTAVTHQALVFVQDLLLDTGVLNQGLIVVSATSPKIVCTAQVVDAGSTKPGGFDLHAIRFNPVAATQE